jgi:hypothetical protein
LTPNLKTRKEAMGSAPEDPAAAREERALFEVLDLAEELIRLKLALGKKIKEGHFDIAAARYSRPHASIGRTQYDMNMEAQVTLATTTSSRVTEEDDKGGEARGGGGAKGGGGEPPPSPPLWYQFEVMDASSAAASSGAAGAGGGADDVLGRGGGEGVEGGTMRRRVGAGVESSRGGDSKGGGGGVDGSVGVVDGREGDEEEREEKVGAGKTSSDNAAAAVVKVRTPVDWFGVMVPPQLRRAERSFRTAVDLVAQIATISSKLRALTPDVVETDVGTKG